MGKRQNPDGYENFLVTLLTDAFGKDVASLFRITFHQIDGLALCRIMVQAAPRAVFVKEVNDERFYIRTGNSTRPLTTKEAIEYCKTHWL